MNDIKLTHYSHGAGCGCKISPAVLETILNQRQPAAPFPSLLVGNDSRDDAAVYDLGDGTGIISTTDFFMPIVDDPQTFGAIASVNALSDVYAMGGEPLMAIAILGWPVNALPAEVANQVLEGSRGVCREANIPLAGGHSIDCPEPVFGLAVTGRVTLSHLKKNNTARQGSKLYLTKPLGIGIVTTAQKKEIVDEKHLEEVVASMLELNTFGAVCGPLPYVSAMTDVTGFGLLGHLAEICEGSNCSAVVDFNKVPRFPFLPDYLDQGAVPGGTQRNWDSYGSKMGKMSEEQRMILSDPQTSGGLLICVDEIHADDFEKVASEKGYSLAAFGKLTKRVEPLVQVI